MPLTINDVYPELLGEIFIELDTNSYLKARQVCRLWREICLQRNVESHQIAKIWSLLGMGQYSTVKRIANGEINMNSSDRKRICDLVVGGGENGSRQRFIYSQQRAALKFTGHGFQDIVEMFFHDRHIRAKLISDVYRPDFGRKLVTSPDGTKVVFANKKRLFLGDLLVFDIRHNHLDGWIELERSFKDRLMDSPVINLDTIDEAMLCWSPDNRSFAILDESRRKLRIFPLRDMEHERKKYKCLCQKKTAQYMFDYPSTGLQLTNGSQIAVVHFRMWDTLVDIETGSQLNIHSYISHRPHTWRPSTIHESHALLTIPFGSNRTIVLGRCENPEILEIDGGANPSSGNSKNSKTRSKQSKHGKSGKQKDKQKQQLCSQLWQYFRFLLSQHRYLCLRLCGIEPVPGDGSFLGFSPYHRQRFLTPVIVRIQDYAKFMPSFEWFISNLEQGNPILNASEDMTEFSFPRDLKVLCPKLDTIQLMPILYGQHMRVSLSLDGRRLAIRVSDHKIYLYTLDNDSLTRVFNGPKPLALPFKTLSSASSPSLADTSFEGDFHLVGTDFLYVGLGAFSQAMMFDLAHHQDAENAKEKASSRGHHHHIFSHLRRPKNS